MYLRSFFFLLFVPLLLFLNNATSRRKGNEYYTVVAFPRLFELFVQKSLVFVYAVKMVLCWTVDIREKKCWCVGNSAGKFHQQRKMSLLFSSASLTRSRSFDVWSVGLGLVVCSSSLSDTSWFDQLCFICSGERASCVGFLACWRNLDVVLWKGVIAQWRLQVAIAVQSGTFVSLPTIFITFIFLVTFHRQSSKTLGLWIQERSFFFSSCALVWWQIWVQFLLSAARFTFEWIQKHIN